MIQDIQHRQASALTRAEWQAIPFRQHIKGPDQKLYDIGAEVSSVVSRVENSKSRVILDGQAYVSERVALLEECKKLQIKMAAWLGKLNEEIPPPHHWPESATMRNPVDDLEKRKIFPVAFRFPNLFIAKIMLDYWALSIILDSTTLRLYLTLKGEGNLRPGQAAHLADYWNMDAAASVSNQFVVSRLEVAQSVRIIKKFADNIAQSMEYCLSEEMGVLGSQWALFAFQAALQTYSYFPDSKELHWLQALNDRICDGKGVKFSRMIAATSWTGGRTGQ